MGSLRGKRELLPISIHALFAEGDRKYAQFNPAYLYQFVYKLTAFEPICVK